MKVEQIYTGCLSQGAYYIQSEGDAAIIDPLREVQPYIDRAISDNAKIKYVFETHFHADFVSGHITLSEKTGAPIVFGPLANPSFKAKIAKDGEEFKIGKVRLKVIHTPGHTMESTTYLLLDETGKEYAIFTGDTLFLGDVGRPDLAQEGQNKTKEDLAGYLYDSIRNKIMTLPNDIIIYPAHGAGSACGKNMMKQTVDTLGNQKKVNYALRADMSKQEFIDEVTHGLTTPPSYFPLNVKLNKEGGYEDIDTILRNGIKPLSPEAFEQIANSTDALILDLRSPDDFAKAHIPKSIFIGLDGSFAPWVGELIVDVQQKLLLIAPKNREVEAITRLARVGFDRVLGYLDGGIEKWICAKKEVDFVDQISVENMIEKERNMDNLIFDVRKEDEYHSEHLTNAKNTPLNTLNEHLSDFPENMNFYIHCAGGYRSMIAISILKSRGIHNTTNISGGFNAIKKSNLPISHYVDLDNQAPV